MARAGLARKVVSKLAQNKTIFNDRLADGRRSIKVWGWTDADYKEAVESLNAAGLPAELKSFDTYDVRGRVHFTQLRIHVQENVKA